MSVKISCFNCSKSTLISNMHHNPITDMYFCDGGECENQYLKKKEEGKLNTLLPEKSFFEQLDAKIIKKHLILADRRTV